MKKSVFPFLMVVSLLLSSCVGRGIDEKMDETLDMVEENMGYFNTYSTEEVAKLAGWFDRHSDKGRLAHAYYCLGRNQFNDGNYSAAIVSYTKALENAEAVSDTLAVAKICRDAARTCASAFNYTDQLLYLARASAAFKSAGYESEAGETLLLLGKTQLSLGKMDEAEEIFKSVLYEAHELCDTLLEAGCLRAYAGLEVTRDDPSPSLAIEMMGRAADDLLFPLDATDKGILSYAYSLAGNQKEARKWLSLSKMAAETEEEMAEVSFREYQIAVRSGDTEKALSALEKVVE